MFICYVYYVQTARFVRDERGIPGEIVQRWEILAIFCRNNYLALKKISN